MFGRLRKHLADNDVLFAKIWKEMAEYFCSKYKWFNEHVDAIYVNNSRNNKFLKFSVEVVWNQFVIEYQNVFGCVMDDNSSLSESVDGSSMARNALSSFRRKKNKGSSNGSSNASY